MTAENFISINFQRSSYFYEHIELKESKKPERISSSRFIHSIYLPFLNFIAYAVFLFFPVSFFEFILNILQRYTLVIKHDKQMIK